jgi:hypothetical protein
MSFVLVKPFCSENPKYCICYQLVRYSINDRFKRTVYQNNNELIQPSMQQVTETDVRSVCSPHFRAWVFATPGYASTGLQRCTKSETTYTRTCKPETTIVQCFC